MGVWPLCSGPELCKTVSAEPKLGVRAENLVGNKVKSETGHGNRKTQAREPVSTQGSDQGGHKRFRTASRACAETAKLGEVKLAAHFMVVRKQRDRGWPES